jgi:ATP-dependent helicase/nuclease subunit B
MEMATARPQPSVYTIQAGTSFARVLCEGIVARVGRDPLALSDVTIFVPTRRAKRTVQDEFARTLDGASLGPRIHALGDLDEDDVEFDLYTDDIELEPAVAPLKRRLELAKLVQRWYGARGTPLPFAQAVAQANELGRFLDQAAEQNADLSELKNLAPESLAAHWQDVTEFLQIVALAWPAFLKDNGLLEPTARRDELIRRRARSLERTPPRNWIIAAGSTGSVPATRELLTVIAGLPLGAVVLPALDGQLDTESWTKLDPGHPQFGLRELLAHIGLDRDDVRPWNESQQVPAQATRLEFLSETLRPPPTTDAWRELIEGRKHAFAHALDGVSLIETSHSQEEALVIALALRESLETTNQTAALVTPDRGLARRVAVELGRWNIAIDDSAGTPLARTPPGAFLAHLAHACAAKLSPVSLLALLKHPLASGQMERAAFRRHVRQIELKSLHGLRPEPALEGIAHALAKSKSDGEIQKTFARIAEILGPFFEKCQANDVSLRELASAHAHAAELLCSTNDQSGADILWRGPAGESAAALVTEMLEHGSDCVLTSGDHYADLFRDLAQARVVRPTYGRHPRLALLGPLEARLQHFDLVILGGLNEGVWPAETTTDPWLSRPMRKQLGLEAPERSTGLAAHDFATLASGANVILTRSAKSDGNPTTPSRWLLRLKQLAKGLEIEEQLQSRKTLLQWARRIDEAKSEKRASRPEPRPPQSVRPRALSVTQIETWLRDPYAIYARHILRLKPLDPIDAEPGPRERGIAIHTALERFLEAFPKKLPDDALEQLMRFGDEAFAEAGASAAATALWRPRFVRAARWFVNYETERRTRAENAVSEIKGELALQTPNGPFTLSGRADRIEFFSDGSAAIVDYKTGRVPSQKQIDTLLSPQLPLEGAMLLHGAFGGAEAKAVAEFVHVQLTGAEPPGKELSYAKDATAKSQESLLRLQERISRYDDEAQPYRSRELMERLSDMSDYDHLARVREWSLVGEGGE